MSRLLASWRDGLRRLVIRRVFGIAAALADADELCVCDLAWVSGRSDKLVSHHLRILRVADLASSRRSGKIVFYRLTLLGRRLLEAALSAEPVVA